MFARRWWVNVMSLLGYTKTLTLKVQRTKHRVGFRTGTRVRELLDLLKSVPLDARVDEVLCEHDEEPGVTTIEFHDETLAE